MIRMVATVGVAAGLVLAAGTARAQMDFTGENEPDQPPAKEETPVSGHDKGKDDKGPQKKLTVFELVGKMLKIKVAVKGSKKVKADVAADIAGKVESAIKDCAVKEIRGNEKKYLVNDDKIYRAKAALGVKLEAGVFKKVKVAFSGKSPIMKTCLGGIEGLETGYGDMNGPLTVAVDTGLK